MRTRLASLVGVLLAAALSGAALGQPSPPTQVEPAPLYQIEILIFANRDFDPGEERFSQELETLPTDHADALLDVPVFDDTNFGPLSQPQPDTPTIGGENGISTGPDIGPGIGPNLGDEPELTEATDPSFRFRLLRPDELQLNSEYRKLQNLSAYVPLVHTGWIQKGLPEEESWPFDLALAGVLNPHGTVRIYLSRFLHIDLDLTYQGSTTGAGVATPAFGDELTELGFAPRYRLVTERQARSGELHFFDHPAFGVLVRITPVPTETPAAVSGRRPAA